jgi:hypothetical protein
MLLFSTDFSNELIQAVEDTSSELVICSAFIKTNAIKHLLRNLSVHVNVTIIARWAKQDLVFGASDLEVYEWCKSKGYRFGVNSNLHAKLYSIDRKLIFLGSANLTHRGLSISGSGNLEIGTCLDPSYADMIKFDTFIDDEVVWIDELLYEKLCREVSHIEDSRFDTYENAWSAEIAGLLSKDISHLWVTDLFFASPEKLWHPNFNSEETVHDFELLRLDIDDLSTEALKDGFMQTRVYQWFRSTVGVGNEVRFGWLSAQLHNALLDDATPYRREIKLFVVIMFDWFKFMPELFEVKKYNVSETVRLKK